VEKGKVVICCIYLRKFADRVEAELEFVKEQLSEIRHNQMTRDEFKLLETRFAPLEHAKNR